MAAINFFSDAALDDNVDISALALGFYGSGGFPASVAVSSYQGTTHVVDTGGTTDSGVTNNITWRHANSGSTEIGGTLRDMTYWKNWDATVNIRFTNAEAVLVQNAELRIYDGSDIDTAPSGVTVKAYEIINPEDTYGSGEGEAAWSTPAGATAMALCDSPGTSGAYALDVTPSADVRHDWYVALSATPTTVGTKNFAAYVSLEYL
jgi:hypothetical protein